MPALTVPVGELSSLGIGKESTAGTFATPTLFHAIEKWTPTSKNTMIPRTGARKRRGQNLPIAGAYDFKGTIVPEADPDTVGQLFAFAMGAQSVALSGTSTLAYANVLTFGNLVSFSTEVNAVTATTDYLGCMVESFSVSFAKNKGLTPTFNIVAFNEILQNSPTSPTFSTKLPPSFENTNNVANLNSVSLSSGGITLHQADISVSNNLDPNYRPYGSRFVNIFPQQQRKVTGKLTLGYESDAARLLFWGASTGPGNSVAGVPFEIKICTTDLADSGLSIPYSFDFLCQNVFITDWSAPIDSGKEIMQQVSFEAAESANSANDDLKITLVSTASAPF